jgi:hypothetical protein
MAAPAHTRSGERAMVPRIVLPVTSRGLEITDRVCWTVLVGAMAAAAGLILYLNRGTVFYADELAWVYATPGLGPREVIEPHNGHLIATSRLAFKAIFETIGDSYVSVRVLGVGAVLLSAGLFYALAKRRIGALPALAPAVVLLFCGSAWGHVVIPIGFPIIFSVAAGLGALLAMERDDRRGDIAACVLLVLAVATYTSGLAFVAGAGVWVLMRQDRWRRSWIVAIPVALYAAWFLWSLSSAASPESEGKITNALLIPSYAADSLAAAVAAVTGLGLDFSDRAQVSLGWGRAAAALAVAALVLRVRRGAVPAMVWVGLAILAAYWTLGALVTEAETLQLPGEVRYIYVGAVGVLLVAVAAATRVRFSTLGLLVLLAATAISLATNIAGLRDGAGAFRNYYTTAARAQFAMLELARDHVDPSFDPESAVPEFSPVGSRAGAYLTVADEYGSLAYSLPELEQQGEGTRQGADQILVRALDLRIEPSPGSVRAADCTTIGAGPGGEVGFELAAGDTLLRARGRNPGELALARFGNAPSAELGAVRSGEGVLLRVPGDTWPKPWRAAVTGARAVEVCSTR